jgi:hypothetical protein
MKIKVETKDVSRQYDVENGFQAVKAFFADISRGKIKLSQVGLIGFWHRADGEKIAFRIPPALFKMGLIDYETLRDSLIQIGDPSSEDLMAMVAKDAWMVEEKARRT